MALTGQIRNQLVDAINHLHSTCTAAAAFVCFQNFLQRRVLNESKAALWPILSVKKNIELACLRNVGV